MIRINDFFSDQFNNLYKDMRDCIHKHYWLKGGRGSTKSSFASLFIIYEMMFDFSQGKMTHAVALRRLDKYLKESVFAQLQWAIETLGVDEFWHPNYSPLKLTYIPSGQTILFRGTDNPKKIKSIKFKKGYCKYAWFEECDEFEGMDSLRIIYQSLNRGGDEFINIYTYNPPKTIANWVNLESNIPYEDKMVHTSDYLGVKPEWLGDQFIKEAEKLKELNPTAYQHEYLGEVVGTGGEIFPNICIREITDSEIDSFWNIKRGLDWGYATDPLHYTVNHYDSKKRTLYIFKEIHQTNLSNRLLIEKINQIDFHDVILCRNIVTCDSAEPKSIDDLIDNNIRAYGAKKGQGSVAFGIKWLQDLESIIIDGSRCPNTAKEFQKYSLEPDKNGGYKNEYPDKDNHSIDAVRYSREDEVNERKIRWLK